MKRRGLLASLASATALGPLAARAQAPAATAAASAPTVGELKPLGNERFQIGRIVVDKRARSVSIPGRVHALDKPLEYLATTPTGRKAYESLLELDASGMEINLACILIGLERDPSVPTWKPLGIDQRPGVPVNLSVAWTDGGKRRQIPAAEALLGAAANGPGGAVDWAYTGSFTSKDGTKIAADMTGSLIAFIKPDNTSVIEAVSGTSQGAYGAVRGNPALPPEGSAIELIVEPRKASK